MTGHNRTVETENKHIRGIPAAQAGIWRDPETHNLEVIVKAARFGVVAFVSALLLTACGEEKNEEQAAQQPAEQPAAEAPAEQPAAEAAPAAESTTQQAATTAPEAGSGGELHVYNWSD